MSEEFNNKLNTLIQKKNDVSGLIQIFDISKNIKNDKVNCVNELISIINMCKDPNIAKNLSHINYLYETYIALNEHDINNHNMGLNLATRITNDYANHIKDDFYRSVTKNIVESKPEKRKVYNEDIKSHSSKRVRRSRTPEPVSRRSITYKDDKIKLSGNRDIKSSVRKRESVHSIRKPIDYSNMDSKSSTKRLQALPIRKKSKSSILSIPKKISKVSEKSNYLTGTFDRKKECRDKHDFNKKFILGWDIRGDDGKYYWLKYSSLIYKYGSKIISNLRNGITRIKFKLKTNNSYNSLYEKWHYCDDVSIIEN